MKTPLASSGSRQSSRQNPFEANNFEPLFHRLCQAAGVASDSDLGRVLGITPQSVTGAKRRKQIPPAWITTISCKHGISSDWLLYGEGAMQPEKATIPGGQIIPVEDAQAAGLVLVPKVKARLSAGGGSFETNGDVSGLYAFRAKWIRGKGKAGQMVLMEVAGDSMEPVICDNDTVLIDQSQTEVLSGKVYAVGIDETVVIKRVDVSPGKLLLKSENKDYAPIEVPVGEDSASVRIIGRVVWWCREAR